MSAPNANTKILPFVERVDLVQREISKRLTNTPAKQNSAIFLLFVFALQIIALLKNGGR